MGPVIAPDGLEWMCSFCGRHGKNKANIGDESCFLNAVLVHEDSIVKSGFDVSAQEIDVNLYDPIPVNLECQVTTEFNTCPRVAEAIVWIRSEKTSYYMCSQHAASSIANSGGALLKVRHGN